MKRKSMRRTIMIMACTAVMMLGSVATCFADTKTTPAYLTVPATPIDVTISEEITMTGTAGLNDMTLSPLSVENNSATGVIGVSKVEAVANTDWAIVASSTDFTKMAVDTKKFALQAAGTHDFSTGAYTTELAVDPGATKTLALSGKIGSMTTALTKEKVADVTCTLSYK